jgi:hypothetical protein
MAEVKRMYVRPMARGSGVGRAILEQLLADAQDEGYRAVRLETLPFMLKAHALYRSVGFIDTPAFDGSEAAISGLADLTYYMQLKLLHRRLESTLLDPAVTATGSQAANRTGSGSGAPHGDQLMSMDLADGRHGGNGDARGVPEP